MNQASVVAHALGLGEPTIGNLYTNVIVVDDIDREIYEDMVQRYSALKENVQRGTKLYIGFNFLSEDIFNSLYKEHVKMRKADEIKASYTLNHQLLKELLGSNEYKELIRFTKNNLIASAIGTQSLQQRALDKIEKYRESFLYKEKYGYHYDGANEGKIISLLNRLRELEGKAEQMDEREQVLSELRNRMDYGKYLSPAQAQAKMDLERDYEKEMEDLRNELEEAQNEQNELKWEMQTIMKEGAEESIITISEVNEFIEMWGFGLDNNNVKYKTSLNDRIQAVSRIRNSENLGKLLKMLGRMKKLIVKKPKKKMDGGHTINSISTGDKIQNIPPSELAKLNHSTLKKDLYRQIQQKQAQNYKKVDVKSVGQGPIIVCEDVSGSMEKKKITWASALSLAALEISQKEKRHFAFIPFNGSVVSHSVKEIHHGNVTLEDVLDIGELDAVGGTNFERALNKALEMLEKSKFKKADILFITDGDAAISTEFLENFKKLKAEKKFYVSTVLINTGKEKVSRGTVDKFSDSVTTISKVADLNEATAEKIFNIIEDEQKYSMFDENEDDVYDDRFDEEEDYDFENGSDNEDDSYENDSDDEDDSYEDDSYENDSYENDSDDEDDSYENDSDNEDDSYDEDDN